MNPEETNQELFMSSMESIPFTEPAAGVPCLYVTGFAIQVPDGMMRLTAWVIALAPDGTEERRIAVRMAMRAETGRALASDLRRAFTRGGH